MSKSAYIHTLGCQMNKLDSQLLMGALKAQGYTQVHDPSEADVILFNTCAVRQHAEDRAYSCVGALKTLKEAKPALVIAVVGCMAQKDQQAIFKRLPHVDVVCGTRELLRLPELIEEARNGHPGHILAVSTERAFRFRRDVSCRLNPLQAYVSVMRGCDNACSYCVVPYVRGGAVSRAPTKVLEEVQALADDGVVEVILLGQDVNAYGKDLLPRGQSLADLLEVVNEVEGIARIRFLTCHPVDMTEETLRAVARLSKVCESLHMPAQSGSDSILARMRRGYTCQEYLDKVARARELMPAVTMVSDFIVGFPGEAETDFAQTVRLMQEVRFRNAYIFKYSPRPHTEAAGWDDDVPLAVKKQRNNELLALQKRISIEDTQAWIGSEVEVLVEGHSKIDPQKLRGRTRGEQVVVFAGSSSLAGRLLRVKITRASALTLFAEVV